MERALEDAVVWTRLEVEIVALKIVGREQEGAFRPERTSNLTEDT